MIHNKYDFKLGISFSLFSLIVFFYLIPNYVGEYKEPAALMPILVTILILILSVIFTFQSIAFNIKSKHESQHTHKLPAANLIYVMIIMIAYSWLLDYAGFVLTSAIGMFVLFSVFKIRDFKKISIIIAVTLGILYISFEKLLYAPLPIGTIIEKLLG